MKLRILLGLLPFALGEQFVIPELASAASQQVSQFKHYVTYAGPTGTASSVLQATPELKIPAKPAATPAAAPYWYEQITHQGISAFNAAPHQYTIYRNVKTYGAAGDGVTDDTAAINRAMQDGSRCGPANCDSSSVTPAVVYFPAGTYLISSSIIDYYGTIILGNPNSLPVLRATPGFTGFGLIDGDQYQNTGNLGFGNIATNIFWRQVRNFVLDMTNVPATSAVTGIHWPTAQATSLQNIVFQMSDAPGTQHQGIFIESGSGGFMNDLVFYGGFNGAVFGNQQFTTRNLTFHNTYTALSQLYDWGWTYQGITVVNCSYGLNMSNGGPSSLTTGSVTMLDSSFTNVGVAVLTGRSGSSSPPAAGSLALENVLLKNVSVAVQYGPYNSTKATLLVGTSPTGSRTISGWGSGNLYAPTGPTATQGAYTAPSRPASLLSGTNYYFRSKPQYETLPVTSFSSVRSGGAAGDGTTDDTAALQSVINSAAAAGKVVFVDAGSYKITKTLQIPKGTRMVGEAYSVLMAAGPFFSNINSPQVLLRVGNPGVTGTVELSDLLVSTIGATAGAILVQWNLAAPAGSPSGMWDVHTRIGGTIGSELQYSQCAAAPNNATVNTNCIAAFMSMWFTPSASGLYLENVWLWTADHDVDDPALRQITVYTGRGMLIESTNGPLWLVGTAVEHHQRYQYQLANTKHVFMGQIQTETPYWQPNPTAGGPYPFNQTLDDPNMGFYCPQGLKGPCDESWGLRVDASTDIHIYGAGLYSFFSDYNVTCSNAGAGSDCQDKIFVYDQKSTSNLFVYNLNTVGTFGQIYRDDTLLARYSDNTNVYPSTVWFFRSN